MKRLIAILLMAIALTLGGPALGEDGPSEAVFFSSFPGGESDYAVEAEDESIVSISVRCVDGEQEEPADGEACGLEVTVSGTEPGSTRVVIRGISPVSEGQYVALTVTVDDALNVRLTPVRTISTFYICRVIEGGFSSYRIDMDDDGYRVSVDEGPDRPFPAEAVDALMEAIDAYDMASWDGFSESDYDILDGENFRLEIGLTDGTGVLARGDNAFPENYGDAMGEIWRILAWNTEDEAE